MTSPAVIPGEKSLSKGPRPNRSHWPLMHHSLAGGHSPLLAALLRAGGRLQVAELVSWLNFHTSVA